MRSPEHGPRGSAENHLKSRLHRVTLIPGRACFLCRTVRWPHSRATVSCASLPAPAGFRGKQVAPLAASFPLVALASLWTGLLEDPTETGRLRFSSSQTHSPPERPPSSAESGPSKIPTRRPRSVIGDSETAPDQATRSSRDQRRGPSPTRGKETSNFKANSVAETRPAHGQFVTLDVPRARAEASP